MMVGELDSIGEAVTGGMISRVVEPAAGDDRGHTHESDCLNCRAPLTGAYCARCGQKAHVHRTIGAFFHDLLHSVLHFDGKSWRTLPLLAWRPGELTRRYIDGQRARFVSPMAMFLFSVFVMFAVLNLTIDTDGVGHSQLTTDFQRSIADSKAKIARLEARKKALQPDQSAIAIDRQITKEREDLAGIENLKAISEDDPGQLNLSSDLAWLREPIERGLKNPDLLIYKIRTSAYKWSWALIPISAPFLWLLFPFSRRFKMYDHVIFVTYSLVFMNLLVVAACLIYLAGLPSIASLLFFIPPVHFYRQLKGAYGLGRLGALWRTLALTLFSIAGLTLFALLMLAVGVL